MRGALVREEIDDARVERKVGFGALDGEVRMASGSVLRLENKDKLAIRRFFVDGIEVKGGRSRLAAAGVSLEGDGKIAVGGFSGLVVIFR